MMTTNPEHSPLSEATSQARPMHQGEKKAVDEFDPDEVLYRRYSLTHVVDGQITPQFIRFPKPSFNRSQFSKPEDVLHVDCCGGKTQPAGLGVLESKVSDLGISEMSGDRRMFTLYAKHEPIETCYAHSELWCSCHPSLDAKPTESVKEAFRIKLARVMRVRIPATV